MSDLSKSWQIFYSNQPDDHEIEEISLIKTDIKENKYHTLQHQMQIENVNFANAENM